MKGGYLHEFCFKAQFSKRWILIRQSLSICIYTILIFLNLYFFEDFSILCVMPKLLCMRMRLWPQRKFGWKGQKVFFTPWTKNRQGHKLTIYSSIIKLAMSYWFASKAKIKSFKILFIFRMKRLYSRRREEIFFKILCINSTEALIKLWTHPPKNYNLVSVITSFQIPTPYYIVLKDFILAYKTHTVHWKRKNNCQSIFDFLNLSSTSRINEDFCSTP